MNYSNEYDFLIDNIKLKKSPEQLKNEAYDYGLNGERVLEIIQELLQNELLTMANVPSLYNSGAVETKILSSDWEQVILKLKKQK
ncbi:hypothetical protein [Lactiplantibacillus plantarum]|uniref:hypothetical protein n=1 Tax=Lactiplantibacillus plantarum TaxID=1590 RepID=UPI0009764C44|nr:hypothetical protein [Lactiplantibacillus plantarum]